MTRIWRTVVTRSMLFVVALVLGGSARAYAQITPAAGYTPPDDTQSIKLGAVIFYDYTTTKSPKSTDADGNAFTPSVFNVARAYINVTGNISHLVAFRITPDVTRFSQAGNGLDGSLTFRIKYAYAQLNLDQWTGNWKSTYVRLGIQQTPFLDYVESIYRYRFQGTLFVEREGALTSSDAGASFHTNLPNNYGDFHVGYYNGEGYSKAEVNNQKALQIRGSVRPFATTSNVAARGLRVTAFYDADHAIKDGDRTRFVFNTAFEHKHFNAGVDYLDQHDQTSVNASKVDANGWSMFVTPFFKEKGNGLEAIVRLDRYKPSATAQPAQQRQRTIAGLAYWFPHPGGASTAALLFDYERVKFNGFPATAANALQQRIAVHGLINF